MVYVFRLYVLNRLYCFFISIHKKVIELLELFDNISFCRLMLNYANLLTTTSGFVSPSRIALNLFVLFNWLVGLKCLTQIKLGWTHANLSGMIDQKGCSPCNFIQGTQSVLSKEAHNLRLKSSDSGLAEFLNLLIDDARLLGFSSVEKLKYAYHVGFMGQGEKEFLLDVLHGSLVW